MFITIALHLFLMDSIHAIHHSDASVARKHNISARRIIQSDLKPERYSDLTHMKKFEGIDLRGINPMWEELAKKQEAVDKIEENRPSWR